MPFGDMERTIMHAHGDVYRLLAARRPYEEIVAALDAFGARFIPELEAAGEAAGAREIRRMVAAGHLDAAMVSDLRLDHCELLLARCFAVGFSSLYARALKLTSFAACCGKQGDVERARLYLEPLIEDLAAEHARTGEEVWASCLRGVRDQLSRLAGPPRDG